MKKFCDGSPWKMAKLTLSKEAKEYIGARFKVCVDMRKTQTSPLMQGASPGGHPCVPSALVLEGDLESILSLPSVQRVDIAALEREISDVRNELTAHGRKQIVDITIVGGSKKTDGQGQVPAEFAAFFENTSAGIALLKSMQEAATEKHPVALYGLTCIPQGGGKAQLKTSRSFSSR